MPEYIKWVGEMFRTGHYKRWADEYNNLLLNFNLRMGAILNYEDKLSNALIDILSDIPSMTDYGMKDPRHLKEDLLTYMYTWMQKSLHQVTVIGLIS